jgi:hypothetical protein
MAPEDAIFDDFIAKLSQRDHSRLEGRGTEMRHFSEQESAGAT